MPVNRKIDSYTSLAHSYWETFPIPADNFHLYWGKKCFNRTFRFLTIWDKTCETFEGETLPKMVIIGKHFPDDHPQNLKYFLTWKLLLKSIFSLVPYSILLFNALWTCTGETLNLIKFVLIVLWNRINYWPILILICQSQGNIGSIRWYVYAYFTLFLTLYSIINMSWGNLKLTKIVLSVVWNRLNCWPIVILIYVKLEYK